jgi:Fur family transcriptional regulator, zinc uptake regulator
MSSKKSPSEQIVSRQEQSGPTARDRSGRTAGHHDQAILAILRSAAAPMSAYGILEALRSSAVIAPMTVYRALARLTKSGAVHRLESLNAYVACGRPDHLAPVAFAICRQCGRVDELVDATVVRRLHEDAVGLGFETETTIVELTGRCASCANATR